MDKILSDDKAPAQAVSEPCACWPGRMCDRVQQCAALAQQPAAQPTPVRDVDGDNERIAATLYEAITPDGPPWARLESSVAERWRRAVQGLSDLSAQLPAVAQVPQGWREFLLEIEWANSTYNRYGDPEPYCVCCEAWQSDGHKPGCKFAAMLAAAPEAPVPHQE